MENQDGANGTKRREKGTEKWHANVQSSQGGGGHLKMTQINQKEMPQPPRVDNRI